MYTGFIGTGNRRTLIGDLGVTGLFFTMGLKLDLRSLFRTIIWAGASLHTSIAVAMLGALLHRLRSTRVRLPGRIAREDVDAGDGPQGESHEEPSQSLALSPVYRHIGKQLVSDQLYFLRF